MTPKFFSNQFHSKECIELNDNCLMEYCICKKCFCHYCQFKNNSAYRKKYLNEYYSQKAFNFFKNEDRKK